MPEGSSLLVNIDLPRSGRAACETIKQYAKPYLALVASLLCLMSMLQTGRAGLSRFFSARALAHGSVLAANRAVDFSSSDPDAYSARSTLLLKQGAPAEAAKDLEYAIAIRPNDYLLWLELAGVRTHLKDTKGALEAMNEAVRLAPFYALPSWRLGNFLLDAGRREEAFTELRRAAGRDRTLLVPLIGLAWETHDGDTDAILQAIQPQNAQAQLVLARFFIERGRVNEGLTLFRSTGGVAAGNQLSIIVALIEVQRFSEAIELLNAPTISERDMHAVVIELIEGKKLNEALAVLRAKSAPERTRRVVLSELLAAGRFTEAVQLFREIDSPSEQEKRLIFTSLLEAKRLTEAIELLRAEGGSERDRRALLTELLGAQMFSEAANLLRDTGASEQERRIVLKALLETKRLSEAVDLLRNNGASDRERRSVLQELVAARMFEQAANLLRAANGVPEQDWHVLISELIKAQKIPEAIAALRASGGAPERDRRSFLSELLAAEQYANAYEVWSIGREGAGKGGMTDGGFEGQNESSYEGFGWRLADSVQAVEISLEKTEPRSGAQCLHVKWLGNQKAVTVPASQIVLVEPGSRYQLNFAARTQQIVSGALPLVTVNEAGKGETRAVLAQSPALPQGTTGWREYSVNFVAPKSAAAVVISVQRQRCANLLCPIFGSAWFDDFSLRKL